MVLIITQTWYPASQAEKAGKVYLEAMKKFPDDRALGKPILRSAIKMTEKGLHGIAVFSVKEGKIKEAMDLQANRLLMFSNAIEDIKMSMDIYYDLVESMPFVGLAAPEE